MYLFALILQLCRRQAPRQMRTSHRHLDCCPSHLLAPLESLMAEIRTARGPWRTRLLRRYTRGDIWRHSDRSTRHPCGFHGTSQQSRTHQRALAYTPPTRVRPAAGAIAIPTCRSLGPLTSRRRRVASSRANPRRCAAAISLGRCCPTRVGCLLQTSRIACRPGHIVPWHLNFAAKRRPVRGAILVPLTVTSNGGTARARQGWLPHRLS